MANPLNDALGADSSAFSPSVHFPSRRVVDVSINTPGTLTVLPYFKFASATTSRYGGCLVTKTSSEGTVEVATSGITTEIFGMTMDSIQDLSAGNYRENPYRAESPLGSKTGLLQGVGTITIRRFTGTALPNYVAIAGASGYPYICSAANNSETVIGLVQTSGIGNVDDPTASGADTPIRLSVKLPAKGANI